MKRTILVALLTTALAIPSYPQDQPSGATGKDKPTYDNGVLTIEELVDNTPDALYHIDGYGCDQSTDHYAPSCAPVHLASEHYKAILNLSDGKSVDISNTHLAGVAKLEAMTQGHKGKWNVHYRVINTRHVYYPFQVIHDHTVEYIEAIFPMTIKGEIHPVSRIIYVDINEPYLHGVDVE
jgi:hypothetical protein